MAQRSEGQWKEDGKYRGFMNYDFYKRRCLNPKSKIYLEYIWLIILKYDGMEGLNRGL